MIVRFDFVCHLDKQTLESITPSFVLCICNAMNFFSPERERERERERKGGGELKGKQHVRYC